MSSAPPTLEPPQGTRVSRSDESAGYPGVGDPFQLEQVTLGHRAGGQQLSAAWRRLDELIRNELHRAQEGAGE